MEVTSKREHVIKLWDRFHKEMQRELHRAKLNKEVHSWHHVVEEAELIEMADLESTPRSTKEKRLSQGGGSGNDNGNNHRNNGSSSKKYKSGSSNPKGYSHEKNGPHKGGSTSHSQSSGHNQSSSSFRGNKPLNGGRNGGGKPSTSSSSGNKLSESKKAELVASNKCFKCEEVGHMARNCPHNNMVKSSNKMGPLGFSVHEMHYDLARDEHLQCLAETMETVDHISIGMMFMSADEDSQSQANISNNEDIPNLEPFLDTDDSDNSDYESDNEAIPSAISPELSHEPELDDLEMFINDFGSVGCNEALLVPGIKNFGHPWSKEDACIKDHNDEPLYCWADNAKEVFGYPETDYTNFILQWEVDSKWRPNKIGDLYQYAAKMSLNHDAPYPGDKLRWGAISSHCFGVFRLNKEMFTIADTESEHGELTISASLL